MNDFSQFQSLPCEGCLTNQSAIASGIITIWSQIFGLVLVNLSHVLRVIPSVHASSYDKNILCVRWTQYANWTHDREVMFVQLILRSNNTQEI
jgi:hypothetical protein